MMLSRTALIVLAILHPAVALADEPDPAADLEQTLRGYAHNIEDFKDYRSQALDERWPITGCHAALATAKSAGVTITDAQTETCKSFVAWHQLAEAEAALTDAQQWNYFLTEIDVASNHEENGATMAASAARCNAELDRLLAAGMPTDIPLRIGNSQPITIPMRDAKSKVCAPLAKRSKSFASDVGTARAERYAKTAAPYKKVGITGDRLALLVDHASYAMFAVGGAELTTPRQLKAPAVIFELLGPGTQGTYTLRRYTFRGDKLVSTTMREFLLRPGRKHYK
jgi:hypothetical protein